MSELLLESLMQLFALLTDFEKEKKSGQARILINDFLERQFNTELAQKYIQLYDTYLIACNSLNRISGKDAADYQNNKNIEQVLSICDKLNNEMEKAPKVLFFIQLLEFINSDGVVTEAENQMIDVLANQLKIDPADYKNLKAFIIDNPFNIPDLSNLLIISGDKNHDKQLYKHIYNEKQQVLIWVLQIKSTNTFVFKYSGGRNLYLNGYKVEQNKIYVFASGSVIKTSIIAPVYYGRIAEMFIERTDKSRIIYKAIDVEHKFNPKLIGVHKFSLIGRSGQLIGIIGGSGTGKSTLLNVLNGNLKLSNGTITINGYNLKTDHEHLQGVIGYVPQDDMLIEELTVYENLYFNVRLCFSTLTEAEIEKLVNKGLDDFDLVEAKNLKVGNPLNKTLSGGQRKRLNIALELIRQPSILFVDEPTSGLSSMDSEKVMLLLKRQTLNGRLVIINIHQPSSDIYKLFDKLLIIDKGGRVVHNGNPMDAIVYFKTMARYVNPEERECQTCGNVKTEQPLRIIEARKVTPDGRLIRERKITPQAWYNFYQTNFEDKFVWKHSAKQDKKEPLPPNLFHKPSKWEQFRIYFLRDALAKLKDQQYLLINFLEAPILAIILGFFTKYISSSNGEFGYWFGENVNIPAYLFMSVVVALFLGLNVSAEEIIKDKKLLKRESFLNLSRFSYLNAKIAILFIISAIQTLSFVLIGNAILEIHGLTLSYWYILFSVACFANLLGLNISSGLNSVVSIYITIPLILVPQMLFSGVIVSFDKLHPSISNQQYVPIVGDIMTSRWGYEALAVNQFQNNHYEKYFFDTECQLNEVSYHSGLLIPELKMRSNEVVYAIENNLAHNAQLHLNILNKELKLLSQQNNPVAKNLDGPIFSIEEFNKTSQKQVNDYLDSLSSYYHSEFRRLNSIKDQTFQSLIQKFKSPENLVEFKQRYYNKALANWLLSKNEPKQIVYNGHQYIPLKNPVLRHGTHKWGRAHFYAATKQFGGLRISTPLFNIIVIWVFAVVFYFALYFRVIRLVIEYFERFKLRRLYRRLQKMTT